ncbi:MAG: metalloprotease TldD [Rhizobiaceae bacterium]
MTTPLTQQFDISESRLKDIVADAVHGADDGELFLEYSEAEALMLDNGRLKTANFNTSQGFGLRAVAGEATGYAHSSEMTEQALLRASDAVSTVKDGYSGTMSAAPQRTNTHLYSEENPILSPGFEAKAKLLQEIDGWVRAKDPRVRQVTASLASSWQHVEILRGDGHLVRDIRPLVRVNISVVVGDGDRQESGSHGVGGRTSFGEFLTEDRWQFVAGEALRQALVNLEAVPAPAGTFDIVLSSGWPGVMLHEAVGHGLEGDFNRKKTSAFAGLMGQQVAAKGVTVVDDGTIPERRGSITVDDEGTPSARNVLIEDGKLVGYMQDRLNARLMGVAATGNGRRESYAHQPMPRMTNTFMTAGDKTPEEIIASVKNGVYAVSFGGGQVDITSGKFVFGCTEAYMIENGKVTQPIKGAMLIGNGPDAMHRVSMIGNDMQLDPGIGTCGKAGQGVAVGVGQPHLRMDQMTLGGTRT